MRDETSLQQLSTEREERERERWSLLRHARDEAERSLSLAAQLNAKELQLQQAQEQLAEVISSCSTLVIFKNYIKYIFRRLEDNYQQAAVCPTKNP